MSKPRSRALYSHPFSKAYWADAFADLKNTRILVVAALMIALRVAMKPLSITIAPNLFINTAFIANALGAMIFGPVVAIPAAFVSDFLGFLLFPQGGTVYFLPYAFVEIAGSVIFALMLYRVKLSATRVVLSRFLICMLVNILLQAPINLLYYKLIMGKSYVMFQVPHIIKNLLMFPIEGWILTFVLTVLAPITYRLGLTFDPGPSKGTLKFTAKQIGLLAVLLVIGVGCTMGYLGYYYNTNSRSANYTVEERPEKNHAVQAYVIDQSDDFDDMPTVTIVESAMQPFLSSKVTYTVAIYEVVGEEPATDAQWAYSKSKAAKDEALARRATATILVDEKTGEVLSYEATAD